MVPKLEESTHDLVTEPTSSDFRGDSKKLPQYIAALSVCMGSVAAGTVLGWTANISVDMEKNGYNDLEITQDVIGWIGSFTTLGAMVMCFPIGYICDLLGRKLAMLLMIIPFMVGWLLIIFADSVDMIYAGRFLTGMAGGAFCVSAPLYTSEIAEKEIRGALGSYFQLLLTVGIFLAYLLGKYIEIKYYTVVCACFPILFGIVFMFQPETPIYSLKKGNLSAARAALVKLRGTSYNVDAEMKDIKDQLEMDKTTKAPFLESLRKPAAKKSLMISFGLMFFQQLSGVNAVIFYAGEIFDSANVALEATDSTIIIGTMQVIATLVSTLVIERLGRKILLIGSATFMAIAGILLGIFFTLKERDLADEDTLSNIGFLPVLSLSIFIIVFSLGFGPIPWMISGEIFPAEIKSTASSAAGTFNWFLAFLITKFYLDIKTEIGGDITFYIFAGFCILATVFIVFIVPETKGKSLEQIQREFSGEKYSESGIDNHAFSTK